MQAENDRHNRANPGAVAYRIGSRAEAEETLRQEIVARYWRVGVTPTEAVIAEQLRLMRGRARRALR